MEHDTSWRWPDVLPLLPSSYDHLDTPVALHSRLRSEPVCAGGFLDRRAAVGHSFHCRALSTPRPRFAPLDGQRLCMHGCSFTYERSLHFRLVRFELLSFRTSHGR